MQPRYDPDQRPSGARRRLLDRSAPGVAVLDVGCWAGYNGAYLMEHRAAVVDGVEPDVLMATRAATRYRHVFAEPVEAVLAGPLAGASALYDVVLLLDVLEHLVDPWDVLRRLRPLLRPGGRLLVSLPNVAHWSLRKQLLLGRWQYAPSGLLDVTHLRFFTSATAAALLQASGYEIVERSASLGPPPLLRLSPGLEERLLAQRPTLFAVQLLFEATSAPTGRPAG